MKTEYVSFHGRTITIKDALIKLFNENTKLFNELNEAKIDILKLERKHTIHESIYPFKLG